MIELAPVFHETSGQAIRDSDIQERVPDDVLRWSLHSRRDPGTGTVANTAMGVLPVLSTLKRLSTADTDIQVRVPDDVLVESTFPTRVPARVQ